MKKILNLIAFTVFGTVFFVSCTGNQPKDESVTAHDEFVSSLTNADTAQVKELCQLFFDKLKAGDKDGAISMLSLSNDSGEIVAMTEDRIQALNRQFTLFPVLDQHLVDYKFGDAADNLMRFKVVFAKDEDGKEETINFGLNPIRKDGKWYLTVRNATAQVAQ